MPLRPHESIENSLLTNLKHLLGAQYVSLSEPSLIAYSRDMWPRSLLRQRLGAVGKAPSLVVWPADTQEVAEVLRLANKQKVPVIPFGAGSGVCGGTLPVHGGIVMDLKRMNAICSISEDDHLLDVQAGMLGEVLERELNRRGWTLGHFPSSIYCSTVGGWLAGRSAGQCSSLYGKIEDMCRSLTWVDSQGGIHETSLHERSTSAWSLDPLILGSEGTLGVITSARLVLRPLPQHRWYGAYRFSSIEDGTRAMRLLLRAGLRPSVLRLYDEFDTLIAKTGSTADLPEQQVKDSLMSDLLGTLNKPLRLAFKGSIKRVLQAPRLLNTIADVLPNGCLMVLVHEGKRHHMSLVGELSDEICRAEGASPLGESPARYWWEHRYGISYKQSTIFSAGGFVDTMEVSCTWDRLSDLYHSVKTSLKGLAFTMAHFSHAYRDGCSIYFTFAGAAKDDVRALDLYDRIWNAAQKAVFEVGASVSHHHGVGLSKAKFLVRQLGKAQYMMDAAKEVFDPQGLLNPGKLGQNNGSVGVGLSGDQEQMEAGEVLHNLERDLGHGKVLARSEVASLPMPVAVVKPENTGDVQTCLKVARNSGTKVVVRGHGTRITSSLPVEMPGDCLLLDTSSLTGIEELNTDSLWVRVKAGTALTDLVEQTMKVGCRPVGIAEDCHGTVGGWLSENSKIPDAILGISQPATNSIQAVLASGLVVKSVQTPRSAVGPDLFSLLSGTSGAFGVVTCASLKLEPLPEVSIVLSASLHSISKALTLIRFCLDGLIPPSKIILTIKGKPGRRRARLSVLLEGSEPLASAASDAVVSMAHRLGGKCRQGNVPGATGEIASFDGKRVLRGNIAWSRLREVLRGVDRKIGTYREALVDLAGFSGCRINVVVPSDAHAATQQETWVDLLDPTGEKRKSFEDDLRWIQGLYKRMDPGALLNPQAWPLRRWEFEY